MFFHFESFLYSRRDESPRRESKSSRLVIEQKQLFPIDFVFSHRDYPITSSSRNGGGPDRSYPSARSGYSDSRSRPYDSHYDRHRMPPPPIGYPDPYSMRGDPYVRDDYYHHHHRGAPLPVDHHGRGPPMRYVILSLEINKHENSFVEKQKKNFTIDRTPISGIVTMLMLIILLE